MKPLRAIIESTEMMSELPEFPGRAVRAWAGVTERGVPFTAYVAAIVVEDGLDMAEFAAALAEMHETALPDTVPETFPVLAAAPAAGEG